ncbi:hypothetical protein PVAND_005782 [Polypedilum vanderplanki]|uniref:Ras-related protein Rab-23 n=1 Tax=Polypedilum vanderplanki TaxID=319348 RepID=A0A9J6C231_POLVA|nr:hypothetical protein PVAND_005782 [Polypedilum vanderplanki]
MREEELEIAIKVIIVGNGGVGKSSMIQRYCKGVFTKEYKKTIGVDFLERIIDVDCEDVRMMCFDTAGQEEFDAITKIYYRGAQACVLAFSTTDRQSFEAIRDWKKKVENECGPDIPTVLVQNKIDMMDQSLVDYEEAELLAQNLGVRLFRTSVKEDLNVSAVFKYLATRCHEIIKLQYNILTLDTPTISQFNPTFHTKRGNDTIILTRPLKSRNLSSRKRFKKCGIL